MSPYPFRRLQLASQLDNDSIAIIVGNRQQIRNLNIKYPFKQDNDFYFLTGFNEPDCVAVIRQGHQQPYLMFARDNDHKAEINFGFRVGLNGLEQRHGVDKAYPIESFEAQLVGLFEQRSKIFVADNHGNHQDSLYRWLTEPSGDDKFDSAKTYRSIHQLAPIIHAMRLVKDQHELALVRHAVDASVAGHIATMKTTKPDINEAQLSATFNRTIADFGCTDVGYPNIVACGDNAICLHYDDNNSNCDDGKLVLADMGGEYLGYTADITRTFPVSGKFSDAQASLYNLVLSALDASIALVRPGQSWNSIYQTNMAVMTRGMIELGILCGDFEQLMADESYKKFTVHKTGHWMGLHVHDVGRYHDNDGNWITFEPNMVFTIEPGIYIPSDCSELDKKWRGIAIRIEDDILVTELGWQNLSVEAPRTIGQIESVMATNQR